MPTLTPDQWRTVSPFLDHALSLSDEERASWLTDFRKQQSDLAILLEKLLEEHHTLAQEHFLEQEPLWPATERRLAGETVGPYRLISRIGEGGMSSVWLAERIDGRFERQVAVKFLRFAVASQALAQRFKREGRILGQLAHPNIAELIDAGVTAHGEPYLVLEYVKGKQIDDFCDERMLGVEARIDVFLHVLDAVAQAHTNLVVHRDIKPSNVFVTDQGDVKLLDFGIAKLLADEKNPSAATQLTLEAGGAMTPLFAAPEQMSGGKITTATDVYSLGVLLYLLLTGQHPAGPRPHSPAELLKAITEKEPARPSEAVDARDEMSARRRSASPEKLRRSFRGDLDTILGKALKKNPQERYASVGAFAEDLRRFLRHVPIGARPDTIGYRAAKFVRRNRKLVTLTTTAVLLVIGSLSTGLYIANRERKAAEQRFDQVRQLANKFIALDNDIRGLPGSTKVRMQIVSDSLQYLTSLGGDVRGDPDLALEIAFAYVRVAHVQGDPTSPNLGQFAEAKVSLDKAQQFVDPVLAQDPLNQRGLFIATTIAHDRMELATFQEHEEEILSWAEKTGDLVERFMHLGAEFTPHEVYSMGYFEQNVANAYATIRHFDKALRAANRAMEIVRPVPSARRVEGSVLGTLVIARWQTGDLDGALDIAKRAVDLQQIQAASGHASLRVNLADAFLAEGLILGKADAEPSLRRYHEAMAVIQRGMEIGEDLASKDASDYLSRSILAVTSIQFANILRHEDPRKALTVYDHALARLTELKPNGSSQLTEADLLAMSSYAARWTGRDEDARGRVQDAFRLLRDAHVYPADKVEPMSETQDALQAQADDYAETGQIVKAVTAYQELLAKLMAWKPDVENDLRDATCIARAWTGLAILLRRAGHVNDAAQLEEQRAELFSHWKSKLPNGDFLIRQSLRQVRRRGTPIAGNSAPRPGMANRQPSSQLVTATRQ
ncbi:MAG: serine/threonine-protein kinase [Candidatus Acidiferrales bacterium]